MSIGPDHSAELKFVVTGRARARVVRQGEPTFLRLGNIWLTINCGGGGTDDKPDVATGPLDLYV